MSRRILPRRGCDPVQIVQPFGFTAAQRQQILDALPCVRGEESEFIAGLERCARRFLWRRKITSNDALILPHGANLYG